jgi:ribosomal protein S18 acetylase RimI-like enzyme
MESAAKRLDVPDAADRIVAVVENNTHARHLYERLGFVQVGMIPNGFLITRGVIPLPLGMGI